MNRLRFLHRDQRGSLSPMILTLTIVLAYMIVWILNTGQTIYDKQRTQDTADAVALVHADWTARSLNIMAMNNVAATQATVIGATSIAFQITTVDFAKRSGEIIKTLEEYMNNWGFGPPSVLPPVPPLTAFYCQNYTIVLIDGGLIKNACMAYQGFRMTMAAAAEAYVVYTEIHYYPPGLILKAADIIGAMNAANEDLVKRLPERIAENAQTLAVLNKVDHVAFHPPCSGASNCNPGREAEGGDLPVRRGLDTEVSSWVEMCIAMEHGTSSYPLPDVLPIQPKMRDAYKQRGFPEGKGPLTAGGKGGNPHIRDHVNEETAINSWLTNWQTFYEAFGRAYYTTVPVEQIKKAISDNIPEDAKDNWLSDVPIIGDVVPTLDDVIDDFVGGSGGEGLPVGVVNMFQLPIDTPPRYEETQSLTENDFTRTFDDTWDDICGPAGSAASALASLIGLDVVPDPYWLKGRPLIAMDPLSTRGSVDDLDLDEVFPKLEEVDDAIALDQLTDFRSLAIVSRAPRARLQAKLFKDAPSSAYAFAESWTHNYTAFDLYTQDWRAALAPADRAGDADLAGTLRATPGAQSFERLANTLDQGGPDGLPILVAH